MSYMRLKLETYYEIYIFNISFPPKLQYLYFENSLEFYIFKNAGRMLRFSGAAVFFTNILYGSLLKRTAY